MAKDFYGEEIKAGNHIAYAVRDGNIATLRKGDVISVSGDIIKIDVDGSSRVVTFRTPSNAIVIRRASN